MLFQSQYLVIKIIIFYISYEAGATLKVRAGSKINFYKRRQDKLLDITPSWDKFCWIAFAAGTMMHSCQLELQAYCINDRVCTLYMLRYIVSVRGDR